MALIARRALIVGLGSIGRRHARLLQARGDIELAYCEPAPAMLERAVAEAGPAPAFADFAAALDWRPDVAVIATPHALHRAQTEQALARGIHVLCEKPMSDTLADARAMRDAARASGAVLCIGFMLQFHPVMKRLKALIVAGELGQIVAVRYLVGAYVTLVNSLSRYQTGLEGALLMDYAHQPDILHWLTGRRPAGVYLAGARGGDLPFSSNPNVLSLVCDYDTPLIATIDLNYVQSPVRHECEVIGDRAWARCDLQAGTIRIGRREAETESTETLAGERDDLYREEHQAFLDAVDGRRPPFRSADEGLVSMAVIEAALASWRQRTRVAVDGTET